MMMIRANNNQERRGKERKRGAKRFRSTASGQLRPQETWSRRTQQKSLVEPGRAVVEPTAAKRTIGTLLLPVQSVQRRQTQALHQSTLKSKEKNAAAAAASAGKAAMTWSQARSFENFVLHSAAAVKPAVKNGFFPIY
jgi:hypothetical protein